MLVRVGLVALLVAVALGTFACSSGVGEYQDAVVAWSEDLSTGPSIQYDSDGKPIGWDAAAARTHVDRLKSSLAELEQISPPPELAAAHDRVVKAFKGVCQYEEGMHDALALADPQGIKAASDMLRIDLAAFSEAWKELAQAVNDAR
jgi:hypothetical protein